MSSNFKVVIPARYASSRFPGKVLIDINGKSMLQHVFERAQKSDAEQIIVATDDQRVYKSAISFGAECCMTDSSHLSGSDRIAEVAAKFAWPEDTVIVNVQADEPLIPVENINQLAQNLFDHSSASMATLVTPFTSREELLSHDNVKVVVDQQGYALYFSRAVIPHDRDELAAYEYQRHIGIYAYSAGFIKKFTELKPSPLEMVEKLEQLRALWYGESIHVAVAEVAPPTGVDTPEDLSALLEIM